MYSGTALQQQKGWVKNQLAKHFGSSTVSCTNKRHWAFYIFKAPAHSNLTVEEINFTVEIDVQSNITFVLYFSIIITQQQIQRGPQVLERDWWMYMCERRKKNKTEKDREAGRESCFSWLCNPYHLWGFGSTSCCCICQSQPQSALAPAPRRPSPAWGPPHVRY